MRTEDTIRIARVPQRLAGAPRLRQGLERWLADCDPARHGLPGEAIVLVRRLATRWSAVLDPDHARRYAPLAALMAGARRAASADADADVVWFADEAELLACIARDALSGKLRERWWWRALQRGLPAGLAGSPALARWLQAPQQMPRAVQRLGVARAVAWMESLGDAGRVQMVEALAEAYGVAPEVRAWVLEGRLPAQVGMPTQDLIASLRHSSPALPLATKAITSATRLHRLCTALAEDAAAAGSPQRLKVMAQVVGMPAPERQALLQRAPAMPPAVQEGRKPALHPPAQAAEVRAGTPIQAAPPSHSPLQLKQAAQAMVFRRAVAPPVDRPAPVKRKPRAPDPPAPAAIGAALAEAPPRTLLHTRHGGLVFLLNAALQLSLYGDFTQPLHKGLDCPPWRFLLLAGRAWCGPGFRFRKDPLWAWLLRRSAGARQPVPLHVWPALHARLALALGDGQAPRQAIRSMLALPARLQDAGERLDLFFPLAELPLAVRLSGLDRDPGWIPAAGCDVRFHFD